MTRKQSIRRHLCWCAVAVMMTTAAQVPPAATTAVNPTLWPKPTSPFKPDAQLEKRVSELLAKMTLEEKVGQVIQPDIANVTPEDMRRYHFGAILNGGNSAPDKDEFAPAAKWLALADAFYNASMDRSNGGQGIPSIWGTDAMHGHSNIVSATLFPHNIGLGATRDPQLIEEIGKVTAAEIRATGLEWTFAPTLTVPQDTRWGRTYEGYSEDQAVVVSYAAAMVRGLQGRPGDADFLRPPHVMATAKHFLGDGGTDTGRDQGNTKVDEATLARIHGAPYAPAIEAGLMSVMASYNSWNGVKMHGHKGALTDVLKGQMGFQGFIVGDWNGHGQVPGCRATSCAASLIAGLDMFMAPDSWRGLYDSTLAQAKSGELPMQRLDDAVTRILRVKFRMGLFEAGAPSKRPGAGNFATLGAPAHRELARRAVRESLVLLKNNGALLPLKPKQKVLVTVDDENKSYSKQSGGWTLTWQGTGADNSRFPGATSIFEGIRDNVLKAGGAAELSTDGSYKAKPDVAIVVFGENPYAEGVGDRRNLLLRADGSNHLEILAKLKAEKIPVVAVFVSGRPLWVNRELNASQAFIAAFLPGSEGAGVADLLFRKADGSVANDFRGKLSFSWPKTATQYALHRDQQGYDPLFAFGFGLTYKDRRELPVLSEDSGVTGADAPGGTVFGGAEASAWKMATSGAVKLSRFDRQRQEDSLRLVWSGIGALGFDSASGEDFSRETNADMMLVLTVKVDVAPEGGATVAVTCGAGCRGSVALESDLRALPKGQWQRLGVPLKCLTKAGADMNRRLTRIELGATGALDLSVNRLALGVDVDRMSGCSTS